MDVGRSMPKVAVEILHVVDDDFPIWVECELIDRFGKAWRFIEKLPVVEAESSISGCPRPGVMACRVIETGRDDQGRAIARIDTDFPWHVKSVDDVIQFEVLTAQLIE